MTNNLDKKDVEKMMWKLRFTCRARFRRTFLRLSLRLCSCSDYYYLSLFFVLPMALHTPSRKTNLSQGETVRQHMSHGGWCDAPARSAVGALVAGRGWVGCRLVWRPLRAFSGHLGGKKICKFRCRPKRVEKNDAIPVP